MEIANRISNANGTAWGSRIEKEKSPTASETGPRLHVTRSSATAGSRENGLIRALNRPAIRPPTIKKIVAKLVANGVAPLITGQFAQVVADEYACGQNHGNSG